MPRPKGVPNKLGAQAKENIVAVFTRLGGTAAMAAWAERNKTEFYRLYARLIPTETVAEIAYRDVSELTDAELAVIVRAGGQANTSHASAEAAEDSDQPPESEFH